MNNREKIEQIYRLYEQKMYWIAYSILGDALDAEDAVQDAFVKLVRSVMKLSNPESDRTKRFVIKTIQSTAIDRYRKKQRERERCTDQDVDDILLTEEPHEKWFTDWEDLRSQLQKLPKDQRDAVVLHLMQGMSMEEIAMEKQVSVSAIRKRYERGMKQLRALANGE